jgi:hypothetical protein
MPHGNRVQFTSNGPFEVVMTSCMQGGRRRFNCILVPPYLVDPVMCSERNDSSTGCWSNSH